MLAFTPICICYNICHFCVTFLFGILLIAAWALHTTKGSTYFLMELDNNFMKKQDNFQMKPIKKHVRREDNYFFSCWRLIFWFFRWLWGLIFVQMKDWMQNTFHCQVNLLFWWWKVCYYFVYTLNVLSRGWYHIENSQQCNRFTA